MTPLDEVVQDILHDTQLSATKRVAKAVALIEAFVRTEELIPVDFPLHVPAEWAHKVPAPAPEPPVDMPSRFEVVDAASGVVIFKTARWWKRW